MEDIKPLSRTHRNLYLFLLLIVFVVVVPFLVFYALGYRWDGGLGVTKTGGVYVHSNLTGTEIYINDALGKKVGFFNRNILFQNLYPTSYNLVIKKEGYNDWRKEVKVYSNLVTEVSSINLPIKIDFIEITEKIGTATGTVPIKNNPQYKKILTNFAPIPVATSSDEIIDPREQYNNFTKLGKISSWIEDGNVIVVWDGSEEARPFYFCDGLNCVSTTTVDRMEEIEYFTFVPGRDDSVIIDISDGIFVIELDNRTTANIQPVLWAQNGQKLDFRVLDGRVYIKDGKRLFEARW